MVVGKKDIWVWVVGCLVDGQDLRMWMDKLHGFGWTCCMDVDGQAAWMWMDMLYGCGWTGHTSVVGQTV